MVPLLNRLRSRTLLNASSTSGSCTVSRSRRLVTQCVRFNCFLSRRQYRPVETIPPATNGWKGRSLAHLAEPKRDRAHASRERAGGRAPARGMLVETSLPKAVELERGEGHEHARVNSCEFLYLVKRKSRRRCFGRSDCPLRVCRRSGACAHGAIDSLNIGTRLPGRLV